MPTPSKNPNPHIQCILQLMETAGVITAFPKVTLSGVLPNRLQTALQAALVAGVNRQIIGELGDCLAVCFSSGNALRVVLTTKGESRIELEKAKAPGY